MMPRLTSREFRTLVQMVLNEQVRPSPHIGIKLEQRHPDFYLGLIAGFEHLRSFTCRVLETHEREDVQDIVEILTVLVSLASADFMSKQEDLPEEYTPYVRQLQALQQERDLQLDLTLMTPDDSVHFHAGLCAALLEANDLLYLHSEEEFLMELRTRTVAVLQHCRIVIVRVRPRFSQN
jgi:hypothetical protein